MSESLNKVLDRWSRRAIAETEDFDIDESIILQWTPTEGWNTFYWEVFTSHGWGKHVNEYKLRDNVQATDHATGLLDETIERLYQGM